jgi:ABC-2 type transport system permease protein
MTARDLPSPARIGGELAKVGAFVRRDLLINWSYRVSFFTDWLGLVIQMVTFYFVGKMISAGSIPAYSGERATYVEFVSIGIAMTSFMYVALTRVVSAMRTEQSLGTLEILMISPTSTPVIQLGSAVYEAIYVPVRTAVFLALVALFFDARFNLAGILPALVVLAAFLPVIWGLGLVSAASALTIRRGGSAVGLATTALTISSGAYFPVQLLPGWSQPLVALNPINVALHAIRTALLGHLPWSTVGTSLLSLVPMAVVSLALGFWVFRLALTRESRKGTLGNY